MLVGCCVVEMSVGAQYDAVFAERFELENFPCDYQKLHITLVSDETSKLVFVPKAALTRQGRRAGKLDMDHSTVVQW